MQVASKAIYAILGTIFIIMGLAALFVPGLALPSDARSPLTIHLVREQAAFAVFLGLMACWCVRHFEQRRFVHLALLLFSALFSVIHWVEFLNGHRHLLSPALNTLPFLALAVTTPTRQKDAAT